jgi:hypothetical protein
MGVGAGTFAGDGSRQPTKLELTVARAQGKLFATYVQKHWLAEDEPVAVSSAPPQSVTREEEPEPMEQLSGDQSAGQGNVEQARPTEVPKDKKESGPCGLPVRCVVV